MPVRASALLLGLAAAVTACGGSSTQPPTPVERPHITVVRGTAEATGSPTPAVLPSGPTQGGGTVATRPGGSSGPGSGGAGATPAPLVGAAPGNYPVSYSASTSGGPPQQPHQGTATLAVSPPATGPFGPAQTLTLQGGSGFSISDDLAYPPQGGVLLVRSASTATTVCPPFVIDPAQPILVVPAQLTAGVSWGPTAFTTSSLQGTYSGSVVGTRVDAVGSESVTVATIHLTITISQGSYCGYQFHGQIDQTADWAPSLHLQVLAHIVSTLRFAAFGTITQTTDEQLLAAHPG